MINYELGDSNQKGEGQKKENEKVDQKTNTEIWKLKQQLKKNKLAGGNEQKTEKTVKVDKKKHHAPNQESSNQKKKEQGQAEQSQPLQKKEFDRLKIILSDISTEHSHLLGDLERQEEMVFKNMKEYVNKNDTLLFIGDRQWNPECQHVSVPGFADSKSAQLVCRYQDLSYFFQSELQKLFCWASVLFSNGSALVKKGALNVIFMAKDKTLPVIISAGSWNYSGFSPLDEEDLQNKYGQNILQYYDWVQSKLISLVILEVGGMQPAEVELSVAQRYKTFRMDKIIW